MTESEKAVMQRALEDLVKAAVAEASECAEQKDFDALHAAKLAVIAIAAQSGQHQANWYVINQSGMATPCVDKADAFQNAKLAQEMFPHNGPHWAVQTFKPQPEQQTEPDPKLLALVQAAKAVLPQLCDSSSRGHAERVALEDAIYAAIAQPKAQP